MVCCNFEIVEKYYVKVYGKVKIGVFLMFVLYLDICFIEGKKLFLFGLFVGFIMKYFKYGL